MESTPKEMLKAYVDSQKFSSTTEIMDAMKEMFRDVLQQVMESELDTELGYEKVSGCRILASKISPEITETDTRKDRENPAWSGRCESPTRSEWRI